MANRQREFYSRAYSQARAAGLPDAQARLAASQASLETNFGQNSVGNNYFGIKAGSSWNGPSVTAGTWEDYGNGPVKERAAFRSYDDPTQSFKDWQSTLGRKWSAALSAPTLSEAVEGLNYGRPGGYATDRNYGSKIRSIDRRYGMDVGFDTTPPANIPTPTPAPDIQGILDTPEPVSPAQYAAYSSPLSSVQRAPLKDVDMRIQQPTMQTVPDLMYDRFATSPFDESRFGPAAATATGKNALRRGLLDQQLDAGILPSLDNPAYAAMQKPDYVDPAVTTAYAQPSIQTAAVQAPDAFDAQPGLAGGLLSPQEQKAVTAQRAYLEQQPFNPQASQFGNKAKQAAGSILGAVLGGMTLGPIGALGGGLLGNVVTRPGGLLGSEFPDAPKSQSRGDGSLTNYGRSVANTSSQFSRALSSGGKGLY